MNSSSEGLDGVSSPTVTRSGSTTDDTSLSSGSNPYYLSNFNLSDPSISTFPINSTSSVDPPSNVLESLSLTLSLLFLCVAFLSTLIYLLNLLKRQSRWLHNLLVDVEAPRINEDAQDVVHVVPVAEVNPQVPAPVLPTVPVVLPQRLVRYRVDQNVIELSYSSGSESSEAYIQCGKISSLSYFYFKLSKVLLLLSYCKSEFLFSKM